MAVNIWKSYMCTAIVKTNIESIPAVMDTTELVVEIRPEKKIQVRTGSEPMTSAMPVQRSAVFSSVYNYKDRLYSFSYDS